MRLGASWLPASALLVSRPLQCPFGGVDASGALVRSLGPPPGRTERRLLSVPPQIREAVARSVAV